jgi:phosphosulfolactate synthase (CoM biosynthesis protein A)
MSEITMAERFGEQVETLSQCHTTMVSILEMCEKMYKESNDAILRQVMGLENDVYSDLRELIAIVGEGVDIVKTVINSPTYAIQPANVAQLTKEHVNQMEVTTTSEDMGILTSHDAVNNFLNEVVEMGFRILGILKEHQKMLTNSTQVF